VRALLKLSAGIDEFNELLGKLVMWLVLAAVLISDGNAIMRKAFDMSSNVYLEIQWYLFAAIFLLGSGYVWLRNAHVRIDFIATRLSKRTNTLIDIAGMLLFTIPLCLILITLSWPVFERASISGEMSQNAGGLIRWPVLLLLPAGFGVLLLQCASELIKRVAFLTGHRAEPMSEVGDKPEAQRLAEELARKTGQDLQDLQALKEAR